MARACHNRATFGNHWRRLLGNARSWRASSSSPRSRSRCRRGLRRRRSLRRRPRQNRWRPASSCLKLAVSRCRRPPVRGRRRDAAVLGRRRTGVVGRKRHRNRPGAGRRRSRPGAARRWSRPAPLRSRAGGDALASAPTVGPGRLEEARVVVVARGAAAADDAEDAEEAREAGAVLDACAERSVAKLDAVARITPLERSRPCGRHSRGHRPGSTATTLGCPCSAAQGGSLCGRGSCPVHTGQLPSWKGKLPVHAGQLPSWKGKLPRARRAAPSVEGQSSPCTQGGSPLGRGSSPCTRSGAPRARGSSPCRRGGSPPRRRRAPRRAKASPPRARDACTPSKVDGLSQRRRINNAASRRSSPGPTPMRTVITLDPP